MKSITRFSANGGSFLRCRAGEGILRNSQWRNAYNALRGINVPRAIGLIEAGEAGAMADLQWLYRSVELQDPVLSGLLSRYEGGILGLNWEIKTVPEDLLPSGVTASQSHDQTVALRDAYERIDNLREALGFLVLARFRGYAHLEKEADAANRVVHLEPVPQWYWVRNGLQGAWEFNAEARSGARRGQPIDPSRFVVREWGRPIDRIGLIAYVRKALSLKDWDAYLDAYGVPPLYITGPEPGAPRRDAACSEMAIQIGVECTGYLPHGAEVKAIDGGNRDGSVFREHLRYQDESIVLAGTGGKLTMLAESGAGTLAGSVHRQAWDELLAAEAAMISEVMQRQIDRAVLAEGFPGQRAVAYFELTSKDSRSTGEVVNDAAKLAAAGYRVDTSQLCERTGYRLEVDPARAQKPTGSAPIPKTEGGQR